MNKPSEDIKEIGEMLKIAESYGLECEVILSAMYYMSSNPGVSIKAATDYGMGEWIK